MNIRSIDGRDDVWPDVVDEGGDVEDDYDFFSVFERCDCPFCKCFNETEYGARCSDCRSGAHQG